VFFFGFVLEGARRRKKDRLTTQNHGCWLISKGVKSILPMNSNR